MGILDKAEMKSVVALIMIGLVVGSWIYFIGVTPIDDTKKLDSTLLIMILANVIIGTVVGVFSWLGFQQGKNLNQGTGVGAPPNTP